MARFQLKGKRQHATVNAMGSEGRHIRASRQEGLISSMVLGMAVFIRRPGSPTPRNVFSEWFNVEGGRIRTIYTAMFYPGPELPVPNWPPYEGNWPLPASIVPTPVPPTRP